MTTRVPARRSPLATVLLLFSAIFLACVSNACASITYYIVDYPSSQANRDLHQLGTASPYTPGTDHISGTIITDGTLGDWGAGQHVTGGTLTFTSPDGTWTYDFGQMWGSGSGMQATSTQLLLPAGGLFGMVAGPPGTLCITLSYYRTGDQSQWNYSGLVYGDGPGYYASFQAISPFLDTPGSIGANDPWVIAQTVPEPASLLVWSMIGGVGLAGAWFRRRRKAA